MQSLREGTSLKGGEYIIKRVLGQGGFGITYLAHQVSLNRVVAIKEFFMKNHCVRNGNTDCVTVPPTGSAIQVEMYRKKFYKEAQTLASLEHPNIVNVIALWEGNGTVYYSMPYMSGGSLKELVERCGKLDEETALRYVRQVAEALKYMHQDRHLCHYDVKPANILLDRKDNAVLIDFGISKNYDTNGNETSYTPIGASEGFAPLEQYNNIKTFSPASDVYSLGATLYFLLTGDVPPSAVDLSQKTSTLQFRSNGSSRTRKLIENAMMIAAKDRPQDVDVFIQQQNVDSKKEVDKLDKDSTLTATNVVSQVDSNEAEFRKLRMTEPLVRKPKYMLLLILVFAAISFLVYIGINGQSNSSLISKISADSICQIGYNYLKSESGYQRDYNKAVKNFIQAADRGQAEAQYWLARCYLEGWGVPKDTLEAVKWFRLSANQEYAAAQNGLGECYEKGWGVAKNSIEAVWWYSKAAAQGLADAQNNLGNCYFWGEGLDQNHREAVWWYNKAAAQGYDWAQNNLGVCYFLGKGVRKDSVKAVDLFLKAANQGLDNAQYNLGKCYADGVGVKRSYEDAVKWYCKAADQGDDEAQYNLGLYYDEIEKNDAEAVKWYNKAAEQGHAKAQYKLGCYYKKGDGVGKSYIESVKWYRKAAEQGLISAQFQLGLYYNDIENNYDEAVKWMSKAANQGYAEAQNNMGFYYVNGLGVKRDLEEAVKWYRKAADQGDASAQYNLAGCYENGEGVAKDKNQAIKWYRKAAEQGDTDAKAALKRLGAND